MSPMAWGIVIVVAVVALIWWWVRPVHWQDGEGPIGPDNNLLDTDRGSLRWWFFGRGDGRLLMNTIEWFENTFLRKR